MYFPEHDEVVLVSVFEETANGMREFAHENRYLPSTSSSVTSGSMQSVASSSFTQSSASVTSTDPATVAKVQAADIGQIPTAPSATPTTQVASTPVTAHVKVSASPQSSTASAKSAGKDTEGESVAASKELR